MSENATHINEPASQTSPSGASPAAAPSAQGGTAAQTGAQGRVHKFALGAREQQKGPGPASDTDASPGPMRENPLPDDRAIPYSTSPASSLMT